MSTSYLTNVMDRYHGGWLKFEEGGDQILIPYLTRVKKIKTTEDFEVIEVLEGKMAKQELSVPFLHKLGNDTYSYFTDEKIKFTKLHMSVNKKSEILTLNDKHYHIKLSDECKKGTYYIGFPIKKNIKNMEYPDETRGGSRFFDSWFPLIKKDEFNLSRFLHYGSYSEGCMTVSHRESGGKSWSDIFVEIMHSRVGGDYLAQIEVS